MSRELVKQEEAVAPRSIYEVFAQMALDPSIDPARIGALMELQFKAEERQAEKEFNAAFARLLPTLPRIVKRGTIEMGAKGSMKFAKYEDVDAALRPLYTGEGFSLSFTSEPTEKGIVLVALLAHSAGHCKTSRLQLPPDVGAGRNALQALGSALSYAKRYLTCDLFNIVTLNQDDDGASFGAITENQAQVLDRAITTVGANKEKFLEIYGVKAVSELPKAIYRAAQAQLEAKLRKSLQDVGADDAEIRDELGRLWK